MLETKQLGLHGKTKLIHNERTKLRATMYNNLGVASAVGGGFLPALAHRDWSASTAIQSMLLGLAGAMVFHVFGVITLRHLKE
jgi:hypothetical protein